MRINSLYLYVFYPNRSRTNPNKLAEFIHAPITGDLSEVPGIGAKTAELLSTNGVSTTYQLFGKFLMFKDKDVGSVGKW